MSLSSRFANAVEEKVSKLALLAKKRAEGRALQPLSDQSHTPTTQKPASSKLSALAKARNGKAKLGINGLKSENNEKDSDKPKLIRKSNLGQAFKAKAHAEARGVPKEPKEPAGSVSKQQNLDSETPSSIVNSGTKRRQIELNPLQIDDSALLESPLRSVSIFLFDDLPRTSEENRRKRRCCAMDIFFAYTNIDPIAKAKSNFNQPSPDDKVLEAQKQAFENDMKKLNIKDTLKEKKPSQAVSTKPFKNIDLVSELSKNPNFSKPNVSFVIIGHVDAGKSTLIGRLLYDVGAVDAKTVNKLVREAEKMGKGSFALAWIMDQTSEERSRGVTVDICATGFETADTRFTAIDAPGHKDFVPQMIGGVSQADAALLVVDSINGEFEAGFVMDGQTKEHTLLVKNLGIDKICVAINKMDREQWSQQRYEDIKEQLSQFLTHEDVGFKTENISFIPISGLTGENVVKRNKNLSELSWFSGPTLLDSLDSIKTSMEPNSADKLLKEDFNLAINDIYDVTNSEFKLRGKILLGCIQAGQTVLIHPTEDYVQVQALFFEEKPVNVAIRGQIVLLKVKTAQLKNKSVEDLSIGDVILKAESPVKSVKTFQASVNMFNMTKPLLVGTPFVLFRNNASVSARISKVHQINGVKKKKMHLVSKQIADVEIEVLDDRALPVATFSDNKSLGRIVIRREGSTIGAGVITGL